LKPADPIARRTVSWCTAHDGSRGLQGRGRAEGRGRGRALPGPEDRDMQKGEPMLPKKISVRCEGPVKRAHKIGVHLLAACITSCNRDAILDAPLDIAMHMDEAGDFASADGQVLDMDMTPDQGPALTCLPDAGICEFPKLPNVPAGEWCNSPDGRICRSNALDWYCVPCACAHAQNEGVCAVAGLACNFGPTYGCQCIASKLKWLCCSDVVKCPDSSPPPGGFCGCTHTLKCTYGETVFECIAFGWTCHSLSGRDAGCS
jgi:hypothetical protein